MDVENGLCGVNSVDVASVDFLPCRLVENDTTEAGCRTLLFWGSLNAA